VSDLAIQQSEDDASLLRAIEFGGSGKRTALAELYRRYYRPLVLSVGRIHQGTRLEDQEDVAQAVFVEVSEGRWRHRGQTTVLGHLVRRARCRLVDQHRSTQAMLRRGQRLAQEGLRDCGPDVLATLTLRERQEQVRLALAELPRGQRQPIELIDLRGMTAPEAADVLELPLTTVKKRRQRGWNRLRQTLAGAIRDDDEEN